MSTVTDQHPRLGATRAVRGLIVESAYATLGLGGAAVELVRSVDRLRMEVPGQVRQLVDQGVATGRSLPDLAGREFQGLARRGRDLVGAIRTSDATHQAVHRTRTARSRVKAATTRRPKPAATRSASTRPRPAKPKAAARADGKR